MHRDRVQGLVRRGEKEQERVPRRDGRGGARPPRA
jgi:hypothetical protein